MVLPTQALLTGVAVAMSLWASMPWMASAGLGLLGAGVIAAATPPSEWRARITAGGLVAAWAGTFVVLSSVLLAKDAWTKLGSYFDAYYAALAWVVAAAILPASRGTGRPALKTRGRLLVMAWAMLASVAWLGGAYLHDRPAAFLIGLLMASALLLLCHFWFRLSAPVIVAVNSLILLIIGLPLADLAVRCADSLRAKSESRKQYYLYGVARENPAAFARWWRNYVTQWHRVEKRIYAPDPDPVLTYRLRPSSHARLLESSFSINSLGFRGPEIPKDKGNAYRIVALGESTTFGITLSAEDQPWPERLEQLIRERLKPRRPVEVINAGVPGYRLDMSLRRFSTDILPLKPDLVISYHGINGFGMLRDAVPAISAATPPAYEERPLRLLADLEYRLKLIHSQRCPPPKRIRRSVPLLNPMETRYAELYRQLVQVTQTNHIRLVLATYSMAVNDRSAPEVVRFYQAGYPLAPWQIQANIAHNAIVRQLARQHPEVTLVDTLPRLDGEHDQFMDLVHFDPVGRQEMAETVFAGLKPILREDLSGL